jgi:hypothetical protein
VCIGIILHSDVMCHCFHGLELDKFLKPHRHFSKCVFWSTRKSLLGLVNILPSNHRADLCNVCQAEEFQWAKTLLTSPLQILFYICVVKKRMWSKEKSLAILHAKLTNTYLSLSLLAGLGVSLRGHSSCQE